MPLKPGNLKKDFMPNAILMFLFIPAIYPWGLVAVCQRILKLMNDNGIGRHPRAHSPKWQEWSHNTSHQILWPAYKKHILKSNFEFFMPQKNYVCMKDKHILLQRKEITFILSIILFVPRMLNFACGFSWLYFSTQVVLPLAGKPTIIMICNRIFT